MPTPATERTLIAALRKSLQGQENGSSRQRGSVRLGIGDDCAILRIPRGHEMLVTTDMSLETLHFRRDWHPAESVGHRCLARGLSDLAAMGATPLAAFLSLALPSKLTLPRRGRPAWRDSFFAGLLALAIKHDLPLAGGDTSQSPAYRGIQNGNTLPGSRGFVIADIVLVGSAPRNRALLRSTAQPGDRIYVTGHLGGSAAELAALAAHPRRFAGTAAPTGAKQAATPALHPHLFPQPRVAVGQALLARRLATAAIDLSDGLSTDLDHLCEESNVAAMLDTIRLPIHPLAAAKENALHLALHGGEDYELLFTASPRTRVPRSLVGVPITCIGEILSCKRGLSRMQLVGSGAHTTPLLPAGWEHYRSR